ncbi:fibronectin type III domain-containing protein [candidate division KSB1 bacterium]|nr:fibronectin type III domain-containing protein [candidate division KSB1 bacterium]
MLGTQTNEAITFVATFALLNTYAILSFTSDKPCVPLVAVSETYLMAELKNGGWKILDSKDIEASVWPLLSGHRTNHKVVVKNLKPDTTYHVRIIGTGNGDFHDDAVALVPGYGKFKTQTPKLTVRFEKIEMIDDSDDLSSGEFQFNFFLNDQYAPNGKNLRYVHLNLGSGCTDVIDWDKKSSNGKQPVMGLFGVDYPLVIHRFS